MSRQLLQALFAGLVVLPLVGCVMTPPLKTAGYGAPGHAEPDEIVVGVGSNVWVRPPEAGPVDTGLLGGSISIPVLARERAASVSNLRLEIGGDGRLSADGPLWADAWGGLRYGGSPRADQRPGVAWDVELGGGGGSFLGIGYGGGFVGGGLGYWVTPALSPFGRARLQVSSGATSPSTLWWDLRGGIAIAAPEVVTFHTVIGGGGWASSAADTDQWLSIELGLSIRIPTRPES